MAVCRQTVGDRIIRIEVDGATEQAKRFAAILVGHGIVQRERAEEKIVGVDVIRRLAAGAFDLGIAQPRFDGADDVRR